MVERLGEKMGERWTKMKSNLDAPRCAKHPPLLPEGKKNTHTHMRAGTHAKRCICHFNGEGIERKERNNRKTCPIPMRLPLPVGTYTTCRISKCGLNTSSQGVSYISTCIFTICTKISPFLCKPTAIINMDLARQS